MEKDINNKKVKNKDSKEKKNVDDKMKKSIDDYLAQIKLMYTPEYFDELAEKSYRDDREYPENFSNWYKHIVDFGKFKHAEIIFNQIFTLEETKKLNAVDVYSEVNFSEIKEMLKPSLDKMKDGVIYNIKNGCYSNKFDFKTSLATKNDLAEQLWKINYMSTFYDTSGYTELVIRELIPYTNELTNPTIYNGMPLREEIRVFYNIDKKKIEYIVDYWDYDYCNEHIQNISDKIVFDWFHNKIGFREINHKQKYKELSDRISIAISDLKFDDELHGIWSIDFLWEQYSDEIYLIDMARGCRSAYWNPEKLTTTE